MLLYLMHGSSACPLLLVAADVKARIMPCGPHHLDL